MRDASMFMADLTMIITMGVFVILMLAVGGAALIGLGRTLLGSEPHGSTSIYNTPRPPSLPPPPQGKPPASERPPDAHAPPPGIWSDF